MATAAIILAIVLAVGAFLILWRRDIGNAREGQAAKEALRDAQAVADARNDAANLERVREQSLRD